ncbi:hypothetical protein GBA52_022653 [Prunus armeniaca]|nr:hypothetical protein GBA52_022653 [Prunus armeniaca]
MLVEKLNQRNIFHTYTKPPPPPPHSSSRKPRRTLLTLFTRHPSSPKRFVSFQLSRSQILTNLNSNLRIQILPNPNLFPLPFPIFPSSSRLSFVTKP